MPFINTKASCEIKKEKELAIKEKLGSAVTLLGKSESWLMLEFQDNCRMYWRGKNDSDMAIVEVALLGKASNSQYDALTAKITEIISQELGIDGGNIYVKYMETEHWGYNGMNF